VEWAGRVEYLAAWEWQKRLVAERAQSERPDRLLLLEHPPTYTLGRAGRRENLLLDEKACAQAGIAVHWVDRGGDITYHGPGQLVGYPILNLRRLYGRLGLARPDLHRYLRDLEEVLIRTIAHFGVEGRRYPGYTGVWVEAAGGPRKVAAIGIRVNSQGISSHGFALNGGPELGHFEGIIPCGIREHGVTSLAQLLGRPLDVVELLAPATAAFADVFQTAVTVATPSLSAYNVEYH
jgi:lipoate-protein ligase B